MLLLGHRGAAHSTAPENTLAAIERALRQGAEGVEVDVRVTADDVPVLHHDATMERTANNGRDISRTGYAELPWIGSHRVPRVSEVLDLMRGRGELVLELKTPSWPVGSSLDPVEAFVAVLRRHRHDVRDVTVSSFDRMRLRAVRSAGLGVRTALLGRPAAPAAGILRQAILDGHEEAHLHLSSLMLRQQVVAEASQHGKSTVCWTVNRPNDLQLCFGLGLRAVITDDPGAARVHLPARATA